jgi:hypothetical protein
VTRRVSLPGAAELFRVTGDSAGAEAIETARRASSAPPVSDPAPLALHEAAPRTSSALDEPQPAQVRGAANDDWDRAPARPLRRRRPAGPDRRPTGRERHEEKITVYCSAEELIELEQARLTLRGDFGLAVDRGRIVREAIAVVLADLEAKGESSILLRRLRGI